MRYYIAIGFAALFLAACGKSTDNCGLSVGNCAKGATACGIELACKDRHIELKCTPPDDGAKTIACECVENNVVKKKVDLVYPWSGDGKATVRSACME